MQAPSRWRTAHAAELTPADAAALVESRARRPVSRLALLVRILLRRGVGPILAAVDIASLAAAAVVTGNVGWPAVVLLAFLLVLNGSARLYASRLTLSVLNDGPALVGRGFVAAAITTAIGVLVHDQLASEQVIYTAGVYVGIVLVTRAVAYTIARAGRRHGLIVHRTLVLGAGEIGGQVAQLMRDHPEYGLAPVGFVDDEPWLAATERPVPVLSGLADLAETIDRYSATQIIIAFSAAREAQLIDVIRTCDRLSCEIFFVPRLFEMSSVGHDMEQLWGMPLVRLRRAPFRSLSWQAKRLLDIAVSSFALIMLAPVYAVIAIAVRSETGSSVLFRQQRVGLDSRPFDILKFCTMRPETDQESATRWSIATDDRVGPVGRFLRRTSLDELPQLWNVLRGDMSLVGPRPERPYFVKQFNHAFTRYMDRHRVPAGMTGWSQVHGLRGNTSIEERARFDNFYVENWSLWFDIKLIVRTVGSLIRHHGR